MEAVNEFTGRKFSSRAYRVAVRIKDGIVICGYTNDQKNLRQGVFILPEGSITLYYDPKKLDLAWCPATQSYVCDLIQDATNRCFTERAYGLYPGRYNYSFDKKYEAVQNFKLFDHKQVKLNAEHFPISDYVTRTIGLEFETSLGSISEKDCFDYGLIPLRDGSISGVEYSTVVLQGNSGFNLLKKQLELLRSYTHFNKECSLHIHFGNFPLDSEKIFRLYLLLLSLQDEVQGYVPNLTFRTEEYKANQKSYCKRLETYSSFKGFYEAMTGQRFYGDFCQPHPNDPGRMHKWNIPTRYYWCNFINLLCYNVNKTVEFRFLRPTYSLEKILSWIYILNGILTYAEGIRTLLDINIPQILKSVYPENIYNMLLEKLNKLSCLCECQAFNGDLIGADMVLENRFFDNKII